MIEVQIGRAIAYNPGRKIVLEHRDIHFVENGECVGGCRLDVIPWPAWMFLEWERRRHQLAVTADAPINNRMLDFHVEPIPLADLDELERDINAPPTSLHDGESMN